MAAFCSDLTPTVQSLDLTVLLCTGFLEALIACPHQKMRRHHQRFSRFTLKIRETLDISASSSALEAPNG
jgi:hypothetical protein